MQDQAGERVGVHHQVASYGMNGTPVRRSRAQTRTCAQRLALGTGLADHPTRPLAHFLDAALKLSPFPPGMALARRHGASFRCDCPERFDSVG
jgi:hypothetical protein